jgi:hypothetical protein
VWEKELDEEEWLEEHDSHFENSMENKELKEEFSYI